MQLLLYFSIYKKLNSAIPYGVALLIFSLYAQAFQMPLLNLTGNIQMV